ncbi:MAG: HlyD family secretion protein [Rhodospirillales bacterium]|nr:HlyD family secretion protein [Rhodospirillales bacterium]MDE2199862.1 HlyD family secretion protein [Rhodospirillales bacterium]MDE2574131.1 HlyD family secretion protein [Rhodospirillales bacterium]
MSQTATTSGTMPRAAVAETRPRHRARRLRPILMLGGVAAVVIVSGAYWLQGGRYVSIDDAYVHAAKLAVSTDVSGIVQTVAVKEGQQVAPGDVLFRLDPHPFEIALAGARANLAQVALSMEAMKGDYQRMLTDVTARQAQMQSDQANFDRFANLVKSGGVTRAEYDDARFRLAVDRAAIEGLKMQAQVQLARLGGNAEVDVTKTPQYLQARSQVDEAQRQLDHTVVRAPFAGIATQVESLQPGMYLGAASAAFGLVSTDNVWIEGNPKETELTWVKPGNKVQISVDTYPGQTWQGRVQSIAPASGAEFSVLPPQNASGNWVKVVQRIPLRVQIDRKAGQPELRAGMSVVIDIDTGHTRHLSDLLP